MKRRIFTLVAMMMMVIGMLAGPAMAAQDTPGTPGETDCQGQTTAWVAQGNYFLPSSQGLGNQPFSPQTIHAAIDIFCETGAVTLPRRG